MSLSLRSTRFESQDFNPNNMVICIRWKGIINLAEAFISLFIVVIDNPLVKEGKIKIPYYGMEDVIVSIRYKKESRGIREASGQSDNFVSVDLQINKRNAHIKLSSGNALVMGVTSIEEGIAAVNCLLDLIYLTDQNLNYLRGASSEVLDATYAYVKSVSTDGAVGMGLPDSDVFVANLEEHTRNDPNSKVDALIAKIMLARGYELKTMSDLKKTLTTVSKQKVIDPDLVEIVETEVTNSAYNYKLQFFDGNGDAVKGVFILKNLALAIINMQNNNITAAHHNWHSKYANVVISTRGMTDDKLNIGDDNNTAQHIHRFNISEEGSIRQWSPSLKEEAYLVHQTLLHILVTLIGDYSDVFMIAE